MGVFSFIKDAGAKVFGIGKAKAEEKTEITDQTRSQEGKEDRKAAKKLEDKIHDLNLEIKDLDIQIEGEMAFVSGMAVDQTTREKIILVVGNTEGIAKVEDSMDVENTEPEAIFHTVERDQNLKAIAKEHYGNEEKYLVIFEANKPMLKEPDKIFPGQVLRIPHLEKK